jgi:hypothetical protein
MTTQTVTVCVNGSKGHKFTATATDDVYTSLVDANSLDIGDVLAGETITGYSGEYAAGVAMWVIKNKNGVIVCCGVCDVTTEQVYHLLSRPYRVQAGDIMQSFCTATPT